MKKALTDGSVREDVGLRYIRLFSEPRSPEAVRATIDEVVAGDHIAYDTSWGTLLGRTALKEYAEILQAAFPTLTFRIDHVASCDGTVYCQWSVDEGHWIRNSNAPGTAPAADHKTMTVRFTDDLIVETWQPCDPWLPLWSERP